MTPAFTRSALNKGIQMSEVKRYKLAAECVVAGHMESLSGKWVKYEDYAALQQQLSATTNSLTNAQEALKSAGIEADTVQAGVMELALMRDKMAAVARDLASAITWADDVGALSMTELKRYDLDGQCEEAISRAKLDIIDAADDFLNAVRAEGAECVQQKLMRMCIVARPSDKETIHALSLKAGEIAARLRAGNAGKDGV